MAVLLLAVGWAWRVAVGKQPNQPTAPGREMVLRGPDAGQAVVRLYAAQPGPPGDGHQLSHPDRHRRKVHHGAGPSPRAKTVGEGAPRRTPGPRHASRSGPPAGGPVAWHRSPAFDCARLVVWMLGIMGVAVALGVYPVIRAADAAAEPCSAA